jgi:hypothetical protein
MGRRISGIIHPLVLVVVQRNRNQHYSRLAW